MSNKNMALLSQSEIDALIEFLLQKKDEPDLKGDILSQESINKLISIVKSASLMGKTIPLNLDLLSEKGNDFLADSGLASPESYELRFSKDPKTGFCLYAYHLSSGEKIDITPSSFATFSNHSDRWGACMAPITFAYIANKLEIKYTENTFTEVKKLFSKVMYGDEKVPVPDFYLP